ncbi:Calcium-transporting ATPase 3 [Zancudomyces culisetae]|uniref:Calcium-transporting ATPase 3 n=1 Tax=Zancudomyces culisetae TaxID=1213189 RepID=A0A1R1PXY7_ZANCU|nr:Calcium-transporting ATPase 3 [Zancudomyces culisetae]|eukprot:OMH85826.1 Calcium-transporting ATPase 3 [Zancudomyces culisetae]
MEELDNTEYYRLSSTETERRLKTMEEGCLTGASRPALKNGKMVSQNKLQLEYRVNMGYAHTIVKGGRGKGIVVATGSKTEIAEKLRKPKKALKGSSTSYEKELSALAQVLLVLVAALMIPIIWIDKLSMNSATLMYGIALGIAVLPKGLELIATRISKYGAKQLSQHKIIAKKMKIIELLGSLTDLCLDKTGVLTLSQRALVKIWIPNEGYYHVSGLGTQPIGEITNISELHTNGEVKKVKTVVTRRNMTLSFYNLTLICSLCNMSEIRVNEKSGECYGIGDPVDIALQLFSSKVKYDRANLIRKYGWKQLCEFSFDQSLETMTVVASNKEGGRFVLMRGVSERVIEHCTHILSNGEVIEKSRSDLHDVVMDQVHTMASNGLEILSLAYRKLEKDELQGSPETWDRRFVENRMIYVGAIGLQAFAQAGIQKNIEYLEKSGIDVHMFTEDYPSTASYFAKNSGLLPTQKKYDPSTSNGSHLDNNSVVTASEFESMTVEEIDSIKCLPKVLARCTLDTKLKLLVALHRRNKVVGVTGSKLGDLSVLKLADLGFALGLSASDAARQFSEAILEDSKLSTIVKAIQIGRDLFHSFQKAIILLVISNISGLVYLLVGSMIINQGDEIVYPISPVAKLMVCLFTGIPLTLALGTEEISEVESIKPKHREEIKIFSRDASFVFITKTKSHPERSVYSHQPEKKQKIHLFVYFQCILNSDDSVQSIR